MEQVLLLFQIMKIQKDLKGVHIVRSDFYKFMEGMLATYALISMLFLLQI